MANVINRTVILNTIHPDFPPLVQRIMDDRNMPAKLTGAVTVAALMIGFIFQSHHAAPPNSGPELAALRFVALTLARSRMEPRAELSHCGRNLLRATDTGRTASDCPRRS